MNTTVAGGLVIAMPPFGSLSNAPNVAEPFLGNAP
jgi:hypothetical protein